jgi:hypothetical protein
MTLRAQVSRIARRSPLVREVARKLVFGTARRLAFARATRKVGTVWTALPYSMMGFKRLSRLYDLAAGLEREGLAGSIVECGVRSGGSSAVFASAARSNREREIWLFDSWEGLPEPSEVDVSFWTGRRGERGSLPSSIETVRELLFEKLHLDPDKIHFAQGWFEKTVPALKTNVGPIALLVLDCSWYESYKLCLNELYDSVVRGGIVWLDDYGIWQGCKQATDEFIAERRLDVTLHPVWEAQGGTYWAVYLRKE